MKIKLATATALLAALIPATSFAVLTSVDLAQKFKADTGTTVDFKVYKKVDPCGKDANRRARYGCIKMPDSSNNQTIFIQKDTKRFMKHVALHECQHYAYGFSHSKNKFAASILDPQWEAKVHMLSACMAQYNSTVKSTTSGKG